MISAIVTQEPVRFVSKEDQDASNPTVFVLRPMRARDKAALATASVRISGDGDFSLKIGEAIKVVALGVQKIENFPTGQTIEAPGEDWINANLSLSLIQELSAEVFNRSFVSEGQLKN